MRGPYDPGQGARCRPAKLLLDPYAKAVEGPVDWHESLFGYHFDRPDARNDDDSAGDQTRCVVISPYFDWGTDHRLRVPYSESVILEAHVRGLTVTHPELPPELRGTYARLAHPAVVPGNRAVSPCRLVTTMLSPKTLISSPVGIGAGRASVGVSATVRSGPPVGRPPESAAGDGDAGIGVLPTG